MRTKDCKKAIKHLDNMYMYLILPQHSYYTMNRLKSEIDSMKQIFNDVIEGHENRVGKSRRYSAAARRHQSHKKVTAKNRKV